MVLPIHPDLLHHREKMFHESMAHRDTLMKKLTAAGHHEQHVDKKYPDALRIIAALRYKNIETHQFYSAHHDLIFQSKGCTSSFESMQTAWTSPWS